MIEQVVVPDHSLFASAVVLVVAPTIPDQELDSIFPVPGRNDPCHCGSGDKYKRCHLDLDQEAWRALALKTRQAEAALAQLCTLPSSEPAFDPEPE